jgi:hypothetical protein
VEYFGDLVAEARDHIGGYLWAPWAGADFSFRVYCEYTEPHIRGD